jgi:exosortase D (VPLPA-CTERM-specific)
MTTETAQNLTTNEPSRPNYILWVLLLLSAGLLGVIYYDGLELMVKWWERDEYSHGYMIPMVALYLVWQKQEALVKAVDYGSWGGAGLLVMGLIIFLMGELGSLYTVIQYAFLIALYGLVISMFGWRATRVIWAALAYLIFMIPLPNFIYNTLSNHLQLISSEIGVFVIRIFDISVFLEGNVIDLGSYQLQVVEACSGLRYLFPLMSFGFLIAYLFKGPIWQKVFLFLSTIPITVLMNSFRIGVIGITVEYWGIEMAEGFLHDFEGWVIFMGCLGVLVFEMWLFYCFSKSDVKFWDRIDLDGPDELVKVSDFPLSVSKQKPLIASFLVLILAAVSLQLLDTRSEAPLERKSFSQFPLYHQGWVGREVAIEDNDLGVLKLTDYIQANFVERRVGLPVNFYVAYYASQTKGASIHSPKSCLPGGGWILSGLSEKTIAGLNNSQGESLVVNRALMRQGEAAQIVYYWFEQRGRNITNEYAAKWYMFVDALLKNRTDGALLRVVVPVNDIAKLDEVEAKADQFLADFYPLMPEYLPGGNK